MCHNIEVELKGTGKPDEIIVVGGHYDTVRGCAGANDNTTGVAATLELARLFAGTEGARTIRFVAFAEHHFRPHTACDRQWIVAIGTFLPLAAFVLLHTGLRHALWIRMAFRGGVLIVMVAVAALVARRPPKLKESDMPSPLSPVRAAIWTAAGIATYLITSQWLAQGVRFTS